MRNACQVTGRSAYSFPLRETVVAFFILTFTPALLFAQPGGEGPERRYVPLPYRGNVEQLFKQHFESTLAKEMMQRLAEDFLKKYQGADLKDLAHQKAEVEKFAKEWIESQKGKKGAPTPEQIQNLQKELKNLVPPQEPPENAGNKNPAEKAKIEFPLPKLPESAPKIPEPDAMHRWFENALKRLENSNLGDHFSNSPAFQEALQQMQKGMMGGGADSSSLANWMEKIPWQDLAKKIPDDAWDRLKDLQLPKLPPALQPNPGMWNPPSVPNPPLPGAFPNVGDFQWSDGIAWILLFGLVALVAVQVWLWQRATRKSRRGKEFFDAGPWPLQPDDVATRNDLLILFEYLALRRFGVQAQPWNHREISNRWIQGLPNEHEIVHAVASLYEILRYTVDPPTELSAQQKSQARTALKHLAGAIA